MYKFVIVCPTMVMYIHQANEMIILHEQLQTISPEQKQ